MKTAFRKMIKTIVDYCFYWWLTDYLQEELRIHFYLEDRDLGLIKQTDMYYVPQIGTYIRFEESEFLIEKVTHAMFGHVAYLEGKFIKSNIKAQ